ncbi:unnamed protein product [Lactuca virosa]|uniref:Uncharacterized protein n=1 Tax=Lactuca virosa TaxID=75947 RepID=A0AAU9NTS5_9ASTR|nr:unnamed protein product [Lactuca virosa]
MVLQAPDLLKIVPVMVIWESHHHLHLNLHVIDPLWSWPLPPPYSMLKLTNVPSFTNGGHYHRLPELSVTQMSSSKLQMMNQERRKMTTFFA